MHSPDSLKATIVEGVFSFLQTHHRIKSYGRIQNMNYVTSLFLGTITALLLSQSVFAQAKFKVYQDPVGNDDAEVETNTDSDIERMGLSCVYNGIMRGTKGTPLANLKPSKKWLALLGAGAQEYFMTTPKYSSTLAMPINLRRDYEKAGVTNPRDQYQIKVIQMIQAFGFCATNKLNANAELTDKPGFGELRTRAKLSTGFLSSREINEKVLLTSMASGNEREDKKSNYKESLRDTSLVYGFKDESGMKDFFTPSQDWANLSVEERRDHFNNFLQKAMGPANGETPSSAYLSTQSDEGVRFRNCLEDIQILQRRSSFFQVSGEYAKNNMALCTSMASSCDLNSSICQGRAPVARPVAAPSKPGKPGAPSAVSPSVPVGVGDMPGTK